MFYSRRYAAVSLFWLAVVSAVSGCSPSAEKSDPTTPVSWSSGFRMPELLAEEVEVRERDDLRRLLDQGWYASIDVVNTQTAEQGSFADCSQYLAEATVGTRTLRENEMAPFLELAAMCRATKALIAARNAAESYLPEQILGRSSPARLPVAVALVTSASEAEKYADDRAVGHWSDVNHGFTVRRISDDAVEYSHSAGTQMLEVVGRGDFDGDRVEDVLISSRDSVAGGSYFNLRLFALTVDAEGEWRLVRDYSAVGSGL